MAGLNQYEYQPSQVLRDTASPPGQPLEFMGYRRRNGKVGTRNEIWVITTVGCVTRTAERIARLGGVLVVGLGCESNQLSKLLAEVGEYDESRTHDEREIAIWKTGVTL